MEARHKNTRFQDCEMRQHDIKLIKCNVYQNIAMYQKPFEAI